MTTATPTIEGGSELALLERIARDIENLARVLTDPPAERMLYGIDDLARAIGVDRRTIERERSAGRFPRPDLNVGKRPLWRPETIRRWIEEGGRV